MKREVKAERIINFLAAGYSGFLVRTNEAKRAADVLDEIISSAQRKDGSVYKVVQWDVISAKQQDPLLPLKELTEKAEDFTVLILHNYHWFLDKPPVIQTVQNYTDVWKNQGKSIIVLSPDTRIPIEIRKDFMLLEMPLPDVKEIKGCMHHVATSAGKMELLDGDNEAVIHAAKGLTKTEIENVLALSYTETKKFDIKLINEQKVQTIEKSGLIDVLQTTKDYNDILGYQRMKTVVSKMITKRTSKGILIVGPPGCGKTLFMECTVGQFNKIGLLINFGRLYSKWQGEGFEQVEEVIDIIEAIGDCVVIMDEFEKQFAGAASSGETDSGVSKRMTGRWLQFMQEKPEGVYMMGTCNSFKGIPDEYLRTGRWDSSPFYIDLPNDEEKALILDYYVKKFKIDNGNAPPMDQWTGAEIEACCQMASNLEVPLIEAAAYIIPQNKRGFSEAEELKEFAINASEIVEPKVKTRKLDLAK